MIEHALIISLTVLFWHACFWPGMVFGFIPELIPELLPKQIRKPLYDCVVCMTPWYGTLICIIFNNQLHVDSLLEFVLTIFIAAGINVLIDKYIGPAFRFSKQ